MGRPGFGLSLVVFTTLVGGALIVGALPNYVEIHGRSPQEWIPRELRAISAAEDQLRERDLDANGVLDYGDLAALDSASLLERTLASGTKHGYTFEVRPGADRRFVWWAVARPIVADGEHGAVFFMNQRGAVWRISTDHPSARADLGATDGDPPIGVQKVPEKPSR